jgi:hypothetical protein
MSDFESRLRDALGAGASGAPDAVGLADAARGRARTRRRTTMAVSAVAVLALVAVPAGVFALRDSGNAGPGIAKDVAPASTVPDGWRVETWHNLEVQVPDDWGYGALTTWCLNGDKPGDPVVQRPEGVVEMIACMPSSGYGVSFFDASRSDHVGDPGPTQLHGAAGASYPDGAWVGHTSVAGGAAVSVVTADEQTAQQILDSATKVDVVDTNGCPSMAPDWSGSGEPDSMSVCRFDAGGQLVQSERLTGQDASDAVAALEAAPETTYAPPCAEEPGGDQPQTEYALMIGGDTTYRVQWTGSACPFHGVFVGGDVRRALTPDVVYWALSPGWSGGVDGDVPLPSELRR